jgi:hypothetical protein
MSIRRSVMPIFTALVLGFGAACGPKDQIPSNPEPPPGKVQLQGKSADTMAPPPPAPPFLPKRGN